MTNQRSYFLRLLPHVKSYPSVARVVVLAIENGDLLDVLQHHNPRRYPDQFVLVVAIESYAYLAPVVEEADYYFMKTVIPSRKASRDYLQRGGSDEDA